MTHITEGLTPEPGNVYQCDALQFLQALPSDYVDCIVTSPPYFGLRDYGMAGQMGLEKTPAEYIANMVDLFREARRVLKSEGNFWLNMGDTYAANRQAQVVDNKHVFVGNNLAMRVPDGLKPKDLLMMPHRLAIALQDDGWWVRQDNVWAKTSPMPESVTDRTTRAHEYVFHLTKSAHYYYDAAAVATPVKGVSVAREQRGRSDHHKNINGAPGQTPHGINAPRPNVRQGGGDFSQRYAEAQPAHGGESHRRNYEYANLRSVWTISTANYREAHFATFPERLAEICILAGCPPGGIVLDMFMGAGTTAVVAIKTGRRYIGSELNPEYVAIAERRIRQPLQVDMFKALGK